MGAIKRAVGLFDGCFSHAKASTVGCDNLQQEPKYIQWERNSEKTVTFYTDMLLDKAQESRRGVTKIAWLLEPPSLHTTHYDYIEKNHKLFKYVLSFNKTFGVNIENFLYYPLGGSWISQVDWGMKKKNRLISLIATQKQKADGHKMRHAVAKVARHYAMDVWGRGYVPIERKLIALEPYMYSVVVESCRIRGYFSEKLIDCISQGTIPIYWGDIDIGEHFNTDGIITFSNLNQLFEIIATNVNVADYKSRLDAAKENLDLCEQYIIAEDWIYLHHKKIFRGAEYVR